jgi:hypothetical protein
MALLSDIAKTAVPVLGPTIGLANAAIRIGTVTATGPIGGAAAAVGIIAEDCKIFFTSKAVFGITKSS